MTELRKFGALIPISREMLLDHGLVEPTEEERRKFDAARAEYARRKQAATAARPVFIAQLAAVTDPVARVVLDLHSADDRGECVGCEYSGYEAEPPGWPCTTVTTVAEAVGVAVPPDLDMADLP